MEKEKSNEVNVIAQLLSYEDRKFDLVFKQLADLIHYTTTVQLMFIEGLIKQAEENRMSILSDPLFKERVERLLEQMQRSLERQMESPTMQTARLTRPPQPTDPLKQELCPSCGKKIFMSSDATKTICPFCDAFLELVADDDGLHERLEKQREKE